METGSCITCSGRIGSSYHINDKDLCLNIILEIRQQSIEILEYDMHQPVCDGEDIYLSLNIYALVMWTMSISLISLYLFASMWNILTSLAR